MPGPGVPGQGVPGQGVPGLGVPGQGVPGTVPPADAHVVLPWQLSPLPIYQPSELEYGLPCL